MATIRRYTRWLIATAVGVTTAGPAPAFYFKGWPGDGLYNPPSLIQSNAPTWGNPPSGRVWDEVNPVSRPPREWTSSETHSPQQVPEPATLLLATVGLGVVMLRRAGSVSDRRPGNDSILVS